MVQIPVDTTLKCGAKPTGIRYVMLFFQDQHSLALLEKSCWNDCSYVWTETLSGMLIMPAHKLCGIVWVYHKILKITPRAYIFQRSFLRGLFLKGLLFRGAFLQREICILKSIGLASLLVGSKFTIFALFYFVFEGNFPSTSPQGGLYLEGRFNGEFFALPVWGAYIWRGLYMEGLIFRILQ